MSRALRSAAQPPEVAAQGAGGGNRTRMTTLEGSRSTIELHPRMSTSGARRGGRIRTADRLPPKQVRYRCATPRDRDASLREGAGRA